MTAYFCPSRGTWATEMCDPDKCDGDVLEHGLRHVGPDRFVQLMNAVENCWEELLVNDVLMEYLEPCIEWMGVSGQSD